MRQPGVTGTDAAVVQAYLAGDRNALATLYDRFGPGLYDTARAMLRDPDAASDVVQDVFCVAAVKLGQLRDPSRVKPWLYAIARHEIFRRTKRRAREGTSLDAIVAEWGDDPVAPPDPHADGGAAIESDLADMVREAAAGLDESDQLLLELSARQGLVGAELAAAMGIPTGQAHSMLFRMRERLERAVGAVVVARGGRRRCADLATVLSGWDGTFNILWRKRIARHVDACATCQDTRRGAAVLSLAGAAPAFAAPLALRARTLEAAHAAADAAVASGDSWSGPSESQGSGAGSNSTGSKRRHRPSRSSRRERRTARRYRFDDEGFPIGFARHRTLVGPIMAALTAGFAIVLATSLWSFRFGGVDGSIGEALAPPPPTTELAVTSTTAAPTTADPTTASTSTSTSTTSSTSTTTSTSTSTSTTSTSTTSTTRPSSPPTTEISVFVVPIDTTTRPPRRTTTTEPSTPSATTTTTSSTTEPPDNDRPTRTTTTTTSTPLVFTRPTSPPTVVIVYPPFIPIFTTSSTYEPPR